MQYNDIVESMIPLTGYRKFYYPFEPCEDKHLQ